MTSITGQEIMDAAAALEDGQKIITRCNSFEEMEALRSQLYKIRTRFSKTHRALAYSLYISREITDAKYYVIVTKELSVSNVVVVDKDGAVKPFERAELTAPDGENETERMKRLMEQDGMSEEEISDALTQKGEDDFDEAATKLEQHLEKTQAAISKKKKKGGDK